MMKVIVDVNVKLMNEPTRHTLRRLTLNTAGDLLGFLGCGGSSDDGGGRGGDGCRRSGDSGRWWTLPGKGGTWEAVAG